MYRTVTMYRLDLPLRQALYQNRSFFSYVVLRNCSVEFLQAIRVDCEQQHSVAIAIVVEPVFPIVTANYR